MSEEASIVLSGIVALVVVCFVAFVFMYAGEAWQCRGYARATGQATTMQGAVCYAEVEPGVWVPRKQAPERRLRLREAK